MADIVSQLRSITKASFSSEPDRRAAVAEARALVTRLESPWETGFHYSWIHPSRMACLRIAMELDLFKKWKAVGGTPKSEDELFELVTCDRLLFCESSIARVAWQMYVHDDKSADFVNKRVSYVTWQLRRCLTLSSPVSLV
jgi:hypothetical protein